METRDQFQGIRIVRLSGSPKEMGRQHGKVLQKEIAFITSHLRQIIADHEGKLAGWLSPYFLPPLTSRLIKRIPSRYIEEMKGIAEGAGVKYSSILLLNVIEEVREMYYRLIGRFVQPFLCSCFVSRDEAGRIIWGRTLEYWLGEKILPSLTTVFVYHPDENDGYPFVAIGWPGIISGLTAISRELALVLLASPTKGVNWRGIPEEILTRHIIQHSSSLLKAKALLTPDKVILGQNVVLVAEGGAAVVELSSQRKQIRWLFNESSLIVTNHFQTLGREDEQPDLYSRPGRTSLPLDFFTRQDSHRRAAQLKTFCAVRPMTIERAKRALQLVANAGTVQAVIGCPSTGELWIAENKLPPVTNGEWLEYNTNDWLR